MFISVLVLLKYMICPKKDIVFKCKTQIQEGKTTIELLLVLTWGILAVYTTWLYTSAKDYAPLKPQDFAILWKLHKQNSSHCQHENPTVIQHKGNIIGFKCKCGYKYLSKRPILQKPPNRT